MLELCGFRVIGALGDDLKKPKLAPYKQHGALLNTIQLSFGAPVEDQNTTKMILMKRSFHK